MIKKQRVTPAAKKRASTAPKRAIVVVAARYTESSGRWATRPATIRDILGNTLEAWCSIRQNGVARVVILTDLTGKTVWVGGKQVKIPRP